MELLRAIFAGLIGPLERLGPTLGMGLFGALTGLGMLWVVGRVTPQGRLSRVRDRMTAAVYELRLYLDSPRRILAAQGRLFALSGLYLLLLLPAMLALLPPLALWYGPLEARYGRAPLPPGEPALVRVRLAPASAGASVAVAAARGARLTAPPIPLEDRRTVYLRLALEGAGPHQVELAVGGTTVTKRLSAEPGAPVSAERRAGLASLLAVGNEAPLAGPFEAIEVVHRPAATRFAGLAVPWWAYWLAVATLTALTLRRPLGVTL